ncbi:MAG: thioredoxin domain-containing protein [Chloroflexi bacterium]|nr:thioredoxin domain-containing protein [Chloroflexota bacterium]
MDQNFVKTGKVKFVYLHMAFIGNESEWAANATECANEQGKFWEYHDKVFENQGGENKGAYAKPVLKRFAKEIGLDSAKFDPCLDQDKYLAKVRADTAKAQQMGVRSTPSFFINGKFLEGALPYEQFAQIINSLLPK